MTNELLIKIVEKNKLYVKWKTTPINLEKYEEIKKQFKECEKNVIKLIKEAKQQYFDRTFTAYRTDLNPCPPHYLSLLCSCGPTIWRNFLRIINIYKN